MYIKWVSDRLLFYTKWTICQLYHGKNILLLDELTMMYGEYYTKTLY